MGSAIAVLIWPTNRVSKPFPSRAWRGPKASVNDGKYPYTRILRFYTNKGAESPSAADFVQFVLSAKGQELMTEMGFVPRL